MCQLYGTAIPLKQNPEEASCHSLVVVVVVASVVVMVDIVACSVVLTIVLDIVAITVVVNVVAIVVVDSMCCMKLVRMTTDIAPICIAT